MPRDDFGLVCVVVYPLELIILQHAVILGWGFPVYNKGSGFHVWQVGDSRTIWYCVRKGVSLKNKANEVEPNYTAIMFISRDNETHSQCEAVYKRNELHSCHRKVIMFHRKAENNTADLLNTAFISEKFSFNIYFCWQIWEFNYYIISIITIKPSNNLTHQISTTCSSHTQQLGFKHEIPYFSGSRRSLLPPSAVRMKTSAAGPLPTSL